MSLRELLPRPASRVAQQDCRLFRFRDTYLHCSLTSVSLHSRRLLVQSAKGEYPLTEWVTF